VGSFSFRSVGKTQQQRTTEQLMSGSTIPIGIKTPLEIGSTDGIFVMHHDLASVVHDNLKNLIMTNWGERLGLYAFGANLRPLTSEWTTQDDFDSQAIERINTAAQKWMSYVNLDSYVSRVDSTEVLGTIVRITVTYNVPSLQVVNRSLEISLNVM